MTETVDSVNKTPAPVPDNEASSNRFVDPMFLEKAEARLADEPDQTAAEIAAGKAEEAAAEEKARIDRGDLSADELKAVLDDNPDPGSEAGAGDDQGEDGKPVGAGDAGTAKDGDDPGSKSGTGAEEAKAGEDDNAGEEDDEDEQAKDGEQGKKPRRRSRARRERRAMERKLAALESEIATLKGTKPAATAAEAEAAEADEIGPAPTIEDHEFDTGEWAKAYTEWSDKRIDQSIRKAIETPKKAEQAAAAEEASKKAWATFREREDDARDRYDDYDDVVYDTTRFIPESAASLIVESEQGPELAYWLATHQDEAMKLRGLSEVQLAREIGRIETRLAAQAPPDDTGDDNSEGAEEAKAAAVAEPKPTSQRQKPRTPTKAPDPVPTLRGSAAPSRDPSKMSQDEYEAWRRSKG
jgi:hypothetical protein